MKNKKRRKVTALSLMFWLIAVTAHAAIMDAPHNDTNDISCQTCHAYSLWWEFSPSTPSIGTAPDAHDAVVSDICLNCHDGNGSAPLALNHSSAVMQTTGHGTWGVGCTDCHNPHYQEQLAWINTATEPYLVEGLITGVTQESQTDPRDNTKTIDVSIINYTVSTPNFEWPESTWGNKSVLGLTVPLNEKRGLLFVHDRNVAANTFSILSANANQIVLRGKLDPAETTSSCTYPECFNGGYNTFGLIYGQLIRDKVRTPDKTTKDVAFFDPNGGFVEESETPRGICQVCHTATVNNKANPKTPRYQDDGVLPVSPDTHSLNNSKNCMACHTHAEGLKGNGHSNEDFAWGTSTCSTVCHAPNGTNNINIVASIHNNDCGNCHVSAGGGGALRAGPAANGVDGSALGQTRASTCDDCHTLASTKTNRATIHHDSKSGYNVAGSCTVCHKADGDTATNKLAANHELSIQLSIDDPQNNVIGCNPCHIAGSEDDTRGTATGAIIDPDNGHVHDSCITCHANNGSQRTRAEIVIQDRVVDPYTPGSNNQCTTCHPVVHRNVDHEINIVNTPACNWCHVDQIGLDLGAKVDSADPKVHDACTTCHTPNYELNTVPSPRGLVDSMGTAGTSRNCGDCHSGATHAFDKHINADHVTLVRNTDAPATIVENCTACHTGTAGIRVDANHASVPTDADDPKVHDACSTCHNLADGKLKPLANVNLQRVSAMPAGTSASNDGGGQCRDCHGAFFDAHTHGAGTAHYISYNATANKSYPDWTEYDNKTNGESCAAACHAGQVETWDAIIAKHNVPTNGAGSCATCHNATDNVSRLGNTRAPNETIQDVIARGGSTVQITCIDCHFDNQVAHVTNHSTFMTGFVDGTATKTTCVETCHSASFATNAADPKVHDNCTVCHDMTPNGSPASNVTLKIGATLKGSALERYIPENATHNDCYDCHDGKDQNGINDGTADYKGNWTLHTNGLDHSTQVLMTTDGTCETCHTLATNEVAPFLTSIHKNGSCGTCHNDFTGVLLSKPSANGPNDATNGAGNCKKCHGNTRHIPTPTHNITAPDTTCTLCHDSLLSGVADAHVGLIVKTANNGVNVGTEITCQTCHTSQQASIKQAIIDGGNNLAVTCYNCHGAHNSETDHNMLGTSYASANNCTTCHGANLNTVTGIVSMHSDIGDGCTTCHAYTTGTDAYANMPLASDVSAAIAAGQSSAGIPATQDCNSCHKTATRHVPNNLVSDHDLIDMGYAAAQGCNAAGCHPTVSNTMESIRALHAVKYTDCTVCHNATRETLANSGVTVADFIISAIQNSTPVTCASCHVHEPIQDHNLVSLTYAGDNNCTTCHGTALDTMTSILTLHGNDCATCHNYTTGTDPYAAMPAGADVTGAIANGKSSGTNPQTQTCASCHNTATRHVPNNLDQDHDLIDKGYASTQGCSASGCHDSIAPSMDSIRALHAVNYTDCKVCHEATRDTLQNSNVSVANFIISAIQNDTAITCANCHAAHDTETDHNQVSITYAADNSCTTCHGTALNTMTSIVTLHGNNCNTCHGYTTGSDNYAGMPAVLDVNAAISGGKGATGAVQTCASCHNTETRHVPNNLVSDHNLISLTYANTQGCDATGCHGTLGTMEAIRALHDANNPDCTVCHEASRDNLTGSGTSVKAFITSAMINNTAVSCASCHAPHDTNGVHDKVSTSYAATNKCSTCHTSPLDTMVAILALHGNTCATCHNYSTGTDAYANIPAAGNVSTAITNGKGDTGSLQDCSSCHKHPAERHVPNDLTGDHNQISLTYANTQGCDTAGCHGTLGTMEAIRALHDVTYPDCSVCHEATRATVNNSGVSVKNFITSAMQNGTAVNCASCHDGHDTNADHNMVNTTYAANNNCTTCHTSPLDNMVAIVSLHGNNCATCHNYTIGSDAYANMPAAGDVSTAIINGKGTSGVAQSCASCHKTATRHVPNNLIGDHELVSLTYANTAGCDTAGCHNVSNTMESIRALHDANYVDCVVCHEESRETTPGSGTTVKALIESAMQNSTAVNCASCHKAHVTDTDHNMVSTTYAATNSCTKCHTTPLDTMTKILTLHGNDCGTCHNYTVGTDNYVGMPLASAVSSAINTGKGTSGTAKDCNSCHASPETRHVPNALENDHDKLSKAYTDSDNNSCATAACHGTLDTMSTISTLHSTVNDVAVDSCLTCHSSSRETSAGSGQSVAAFIVNAIRTNGLADCGSCHSGYANNHNHSHSVTAGSNQLSDTSEACGECHKISGVDWTQNWTNIRTKHNVSTNGNGSCTTCHSSTDRVSRTGNAGAPNGNEFISAVITRGISGTAIFCLDCHYDNRVTHVSDHSLFVGSDSNCITCHSASNTLTGLHITDGCITCHSKTTGTMQASDMLGSAQNHRVPENGASNTCSTCHGDKHNGNIESDHNNVNTAYGASNNCSTCHGGALNTMADIASVHGNVCETCHTYNGTGTDTYTGMPAASAVSAAINNGKGAGGSSQSCFSCHNGTATKHVPNSLETDHNKLDVAYAAAKGCDATGCHGALGNMEAVRALHDVNYVNCTVCHEASRETLSGSGVTVAHFIVTAIRTNSAVNCASCHAPHSTNTDHNMVSTSYAATNNCTTCHGSPLNTMDSIVTLHGNSCDTCHDYTTGSDFYAGMPAASDVNNAITNGTGDTGTALDCSTCHNTATRHVPNNLAGDHNLISLTYANTGGCDACHGTLNNMEAIRSLHDLNYVDCTVCHDATRETTSGSGVSVANFIISAMQNGTAVSCASCHTPHNTTTDHNNRAIAFGSLGHVCSNCHTSDTSIGLGSPGNGNLASQADIDALHGNNCDLCHNYNAATMANAEGLPLQATVDNAVANGITGSVNATCVVCHDYNEDPAQHGGHSVPDTLTGKAGNCTICHDRENTLEVVSGIHNNNCTNCHTSPPTLASALDKPNAIKIERGGDCTDCHGALYSHDNANHSKIVFGNDGIGNTGCDGCHDPDPIVEHTTIRGWDCSVCHNNPCYDDTINAAIDGVVAQVFCTDCHVDRDFPHGLIDHVGFGKVTEDILCAACHNPNHDKDWIIDIHGNGTVSDCGMCHVNTAGAGALLPVLENDANAFDGGFCTECHNATLTLPGGEFHGVATTDPILQARHNNLATAVGETVTMSNPKIIQALDEYNCDDCHPGTTVQERLEEHPGCVTCHNGNAAFEAVIFNGMQGGNNLEQVCESCHNATINGGGATNAPSGKAMYQYDGVRHHDTEYAQNGECDYCHTDPRPAWEVTYGVNGPNPLPGQLACRECHVEKGTNGVVVTKNSYTPTNVYFTSNSSWNLNTVASVEKVTQHEILSNSPIAVNNYGACMFCHSVNVWHAKPTWNKGHDSAGSNKDDTFDVLREAPGRSVWPNRPSSGDNDPTNDGGTALFDIFSTGSNTGGVEKLRMYGRYNFGSAGEPYEGTSSESRAEGSIYSRYESSNSNVWIRTLANAPLGFSRVTIPQATQLNDAEGLMSSNPMVPVFPEISTPTAVGADLVDIIDAGWNVNNSGQLQVIAVNRSADAVTLSISYGSQVNNEAMIWDASINAWIYTSAAPVIFDGSSVTVTSNHAGGGNDSLTVRDLTSNDVVAGATYTAQIHIDNEANNIPNSSVDAGLCTDCHTGNLSIEHAIRGKSCSVCHAPCETPPKPLSNVDCFTCHYQNDPNDPRAQPSNHPEDVMPEHPFLLNAPNECTGCHKQANVAAAIHNSCFSCHNPSYDPNNMQFGDNGDASLHQRGTNSECTVCHVDYGFNFTDGHKNEDHSLAVTGAGSDNCTSCHADSDIIGSVHNNDCNNCHTNSVSNGVLTGSAADHIIGGTSSCVSCHTGHNDNFKDGHLPANHSNLVASTSTTPLLDCSNVLCHGPDVVTGALNHNNNCASCHTNTTNNGSLRVGAKGDATRHQIKEVSECNTCHGGFSLHESVHNVIEVGPNDFAQEYDPGNGWPNGQPCSNCHNDTGGDLVTWNDIFVEHLSNCTYCHNATRTINRNDASVTRTIQDVITDGINNPGTPIHCLDCHQSKTAPALHNIAHVRQLRVTADPQCVSCHMEDNVDTNTDYFVIQRLHKNRCETCHITAAGGGALVDYSVDCSNSLFPANQAECIDYEAINFGQGGSCTSCHIRYGQNFATGHWNADHSGLSGSTNCSGCHDHANTDEIVTRQSTHKESCTRCHTDLVADGTLRVGTTGDATVHRLGSTSSCATCHPNEAANFQDTHGVSDHNGITGTATCMTCHTGDFIAVEHNRSKSCDNCHTNLPTNGALRTAPNGIASNHSNGDFSGCVTCHVDYEANFSAAGAHKNPDHSGLIANDGPTNSTNCGGCHFNTTNVSNVTGAQIVADHANDCTNCHTNTVGDFVSGSRGSAKGHDIDTPSNCVNCHGSYGYFDSHTHIHDVAQGNNDLAQQSNQPCSNCHGTLATWPNVFTIHRSDCTTCHDSTDNTVENVIASHSGTVRCLDCHATKTAPAEHGIISHETQGKVTWSTLCARCHNATGNADVIYDVHKVGTKNMCGVCHDNAYGIGALREPWETNSPAGGECTTCHSFTAMDRHHTSDQTQAGDCTHCHTDPRPEWATDFGTFLPNPLPKQLACVECHVKPDGTGLVVYKNTYTPTNVNSFPNGVEAFAVNGAATVVQTPVHTIVGPRKIDVYNYGACLNCHDGSYPGAAQIQIWHAKPTWNKNTHDTSNSNYDNLFDTLRYAPGRSEVTSTGTVIDSKFNLFYDGANTGTTKVRMYGRYDFGDSGKPYKHTNSENRGKRLYSDYETNNSNPWYQDRYTQTFLVPRINSINNPQGLISSNPQVPYFDDIAAPIVADEVHISKAEWDGSQLTVWAFNDYTDKVNLTFNYNGSTGNAMTYNGTVGRWEGTLTSAFASTVTVNSDALGGGTTTKIVTDTTATPDILYVTKAEWDNSNGGTVTVWATHSLNNGMLAYEVDYNGFTGAAMTWNGAGSQYELVVNGVPYGGLLTMASIHSHNAGGAFVTVPVTDVSGAAQDKIVVTRAVWDWADNQSLTIHANHLLNDGTRSYQIEYNGSTGDLVWNDLRYRYDAIVYGVTYNGPTMATITSPDEGGDTTTFYINDITGTVDHEALQKVGKTASCAKCHDWNEADPKDVITDIHNGKCSHCHTTWPNLKTGIVAGDCVSCHGGSTDYHPASTLHDQITFGFGEGNACARTCHNDIPLQEHIGGAVTGRTWECTSCHGTPYYSGLISAAIAGTDPVYCTDCHKNQSFPHGSRNHAIRKTNNCAGCHNGVDPVNDIHMLPGSGNDCDTCHASSDTTVINIINAGSGDCADCHAERYVHQAVPTHDISGSCASCHTAGNFNELVDLHRDTCGTCHNSTNVTVKSVIATGGAVDCADCHGAGGDHHNNAYAQAGDCAHCHTDPRPGWISTYGTITPNPMPKQLPCVKCHVESTGTGLVVYKNTYTPTNVSSFPNGAQNWGVNGDAVTQQTPIHTINGPAKINVYDYGICLGCHDGNTPGAAAIQVWHAKPSHNDTNNSTYDNPFDVFRSAPGRSYFANNNTPPDRNSTDVNANNRLFNIFASNTGLGGAGQIRIGQDKYYEGTGSENRGDKLYTNYQRTSDNPWYGSVWNLRVTIPRVNAVNNQQGLLSSNPSIPYYSDITAPVVSGSGSDNVAITQAWWYETNAETHVGDLIISAVNSKTATLQYNGVDMTQVGNHWEITLASQVYPVSVTVTSTDAGGGSSVAIVEDMSCYTCGYDSTNVPHSYISNLPNGRCDECHVGSLLDEHMNRGMSCSNCHENPNPVVIRAIDEGIYNAVTCETCHGPKTPEHPYDLHTHTVGQHANDLAQPVPAPCSDCHAVESWNQIMGYTHNQPTNGPGPCNTCHLSDRLAVQDAILHNGFHAVSCVDCHAAEESPAAHGNAHQIVFNPVSDVAQADSQPCNNCHGDLDNYIDILILHEHNCDVCHTATRTINPLDPTETSTVADVILAGAQTDCLDCHAAQAAPAFHGPNHPLVITGMRANTYGDSLQCQGCHAANTYAEHLEPGGIAYEKYMNAGTPFECSWCHQYLPVAPGMTFSDDPAINNAISIGVNHQGDVYCSDCHEQNANRLDPYGHGWSVKYADPDYQVSAAHHESSPAALSGQCTACHVDPRLDPYGTGEALPAPKMLPCRDCHVKSDPIGGNYGTGQFTVYKDRAAVQVDYGTEIGWDWDFVEPIANTDPIGQTGLAHQWDVEGGMIDSFGICLFCHKMRPYHAQVPPPADDLNKSLAGPSDPPYYATPGRGSLGVFYGTYRKPNDYYVGTSQGGLPQGSDTNRQNLESIRDHDSRPRADISYWAMITYDPQNNPHGNVPTDHIMGIPEYFTVPTFDPPVGGDIVSISQATFNNTTMELNVTAHNTTTGSGYELYAIHSGVTVAMTENTTGTWTATFTGYPYDISDQIGRVYVISVDPIANFVLVDQAFTNPAITDNLEVLKAEWNEVNVGSELFIQIHNSAPGAIVTVTYDGVDYVMTEGNTGHYMVSIPAPTYISTFDVRTNANGLLTNEPITNATVGGGNGCEIEANGTYIEAENYSTFGNNWQAASTVSGANGNQYLNAVANDLGQPSGVPATYVVNFTQTGTYNISFRGYDGSNTGDNSLWYGLDGIMAGNTTTPGRNNNWNWTQTPHSVGPNPNAITVTSTGPHVINIWARENNFKFDGFYLKLNDATLPSGGIPNGAMMLDPNTCDGGGGSGTPPFADQVDDFSNLTTGPTGRPVFGNWTGVQVGNTTNTPWTAWCGQTPSSSTSVGPSVDYDGGTNCSSDVYVYMEGSATSATNGVGVTSNSVQYLESSSVLNGSMYSFTFSFYYNMNFNGLTDGSLAVEVWNGASWVTVQNIATGDQHTSTAWTKSPDYNLSSYINGDMKIRIKFTVGSNSAYRYDLGVDHMVVTGTIR